MLSTSFKTFDLMFLRPPRWFFVPTLANYEELLFQRGYLRFFLNSTLVSCVSTALTLMISTPAAYALARINFRKRENIAFWILSIRMFPPIVVLVPLFYIFRTLHLTGSYTSLILAYQILNIPLAVWMLRGFFAELPGELEDAALIDGCSHLGVLIKIFVPISKSGIVATALLSFVFCWNEFLFASVFTSLETRTIPVAVTQFIRMRGVMWGPMTAAAMTTVVLVWLVTLSIQRHIIRGMTLGAIK
jgi:ABC-type glycerol-3-phosphate transport system permease component